MVAVQKQDLVDSGHAPSLTYTLVEEEQVLWDSLDRKQSVRQRVGVEDFLLKTCFVD